MNNTPNFYFVHIYDGNIELSNELVQLREYKIISPVNNKKIFKKSNFHCAWFIYNNDVLCGPINIDTEIVKSGKRIIKDDDFPLYNGKEITNVTKYEIPNHDISDLNLFYLKNCVDV